MQWLLPRGNTRAGASRQIDRRFAGLKLNSVLLAVGNKLVEQYQPSKILGSGGVLSPAVTQLGAAVQRISGDSAFTNLNQNVLTFSRIAVVKPIDTSENAISVSNSNGTNGSAQFTIYAGTAGRIDLTASNLFVVAQSPNVNVEVGKTSVVGVTCEVVGAGATIKFYLNGRFLSTHSVSAPGFASNGSGLVFSKFGGANPFNGALGLHLDFASALDTATMMSLTRNPYQIFAPSKYPVLFAPSISATPIPFLSWFDSELFANSWFDPELNTAAWFDSEFIQPASGGGPTIVDLTLASLGFSSKTTQNRANVSVTSALLNRVAQAVQNRLTVSQTSALLNQDPQPTQNRIAVTATSALLNQDAQSVQNRLAVTTTTPNLDFDASPVQNSLLTTLASALLNFTAHMVDAANSGAGVVVDLTLAAFNFVAQSVQNRLSVLPTAASLKLNAQSVQNRVTAGLTIASLKLNAQGIQLRLTGSLALQQLKINAQSVQNRVVVALTNAQIILTASAVSARLLITTTTAQIIFSAKSVQTRLIVSLTKANLFFNAQIVEVAGGAIVVVAAKLRWSASRFRQLLKQRRF